MKERMVGSKLKSTSNRWLIRNYICNYNKVPVVHPYYQAIIAPAQS